MSPYREVDHTADWALRVWAPTLAELFVDAARGMYDLVGAAPDVAAAEAAGTVRREVVLTAGDYESLLVAWLQELLYFTESEGLVFDGFKIEALAPTELRAEIAGRPMERPVKVIKAVTYHNLALSTTDSGYEVTVVFDV